MERRHGRARGFVRRERSSARSGPSAELVAAAARANRCRAADRKRAPIRRVCVCGLLGKALSNRLTSRARVVSARVFFWGVPKSACALTLQASERPAPRGQHKFDNVPARSRCPKAKKDGGKPRTFNAKERASRTKRGDNDYVQEEKRILRQTTDGFSMGY